MLKTLVLSVLLAIPGLAQAYTWKATSVASSISPATYMAIYNAPVPWCNPNPWYATTTPTCSTLGSSCKAVRLLTVGGNRTYIAGLFKCQ